MNVESVGEKPINKKKWIILFSVFGVLIVGLIIAIVVVLIIRNNNTQEVPEVNDEYNGALMLYLDDNEDIATTVAAQELDGEGMLKLLKEKIDSEENEMTRAMLEQDYYMTLFAVDVSDTSKKDEILNGLIRVEEILKTASASEAVANIALAYGDFDLYYKYADITKERDPDYKTIYEMAEEFSE